MSVQVSEAKDNLSYYRRTFLGENQGQETSYAQRPLIRSDNRNIFIVDWENLLFNEHFEQMTNNQLYEIFRIWSDEISLEKDCPNHVLGQHVDYIRYLYRLVTISYLFESLLNYRGVLSQLGSEKMCVVDWNSIFSKCKPEDPEMKKFLLRLNGRMDKFLNWSQYPSLGKTKKEELLKHFEDILRGKSEGTGPIEKRLSHHCKKNVCNGTASGQVIGNYVAQFCQEEKDLIKELCSEKDGLYSASYINEIRLLVEHSNAMSVIRKEGNASGCLRRFQEIFKVHEKHYEQLPIIFGSVMEYLIEKQSRYMQGDAYIVGALKEFDDRGLTDLLVTKEEEKPVEVASSKKIVIAKTPVVEIKKEEVAASVSKKDEVVKKEKEKSISQFELAYVEKIKGKIPQVAVNMDLLREDYEFSEKIVKTLSGPMRTYQTRKALTEMKKFDHLGSKSTPMRLIFLKFLIEHDFHQGLFNMTDILGSKFWVLNDIDNIKEPRFIELKNAPSTNNRWQIYLTDPPEELEQQVDKLKFNLKG